MTNTDLYPMEPDFKPLVGEKERMAMFGPFDYEKSPTKDNPEHVTILNDWVSDNIVRVQVPLLEKMGFGRFQSFHIKASKQFTELWNAWHLDGYDQYILQYGGTFCPRLIRGGSTLSNHAFGTAFDINVPWNPLGTAPASLGAKGCVMPLIDRANEFGFYWGGHYKKRKDGMHFEIAKLL